MNTMLNISSGPHLRDKWTTAFIMKLVVIALIPTAIIGVIVNGINALLVILVSIVTCVATEFLFDKACHKPDTWKDFSAVVTGLLLALSLSPAVPLYVPVWAGVFAILIVKCCFGGLGRNFINPALAGRCFALISFGRAMSTFTVDSVTSATPIVDLMSGETVNITQMFWGTSNAVIGSSIIAMLAGGLFLWVMDVIHGQICFSVLAGFTLILGLFGGQGFDPGYLLAHLCGGGVIMGAFFMATDYTTSPVSRLGQTVYGLLIGILGALFRLYGSTADSFSYSIIIANLFTPLIDKYLVATPFAFQWVMVHLKLSEKENLWQRIPRPVVVLMVITLIAGVSLSGVYALTKDTIEERERLERAASYRVVVPDAESFEADVLLDEYVAALPNGLYDADTGRTYINEVMAGKDADGNTVGYAISVTSGDGFNGNVTLAVGISADDIVNSIAFTSINETPGMGMRCADPEFKDQFDGRTAARFTLVKSGASYDGDNGIDAVSGATVTSTAVTNAVNAAVDFFLNVVKGGN